MMIQTNCKGHTIVELLIALFLTGLISMAGLKFYVNTQNQALAQEDVGDMQNVARATLDEIVRNLRQAGYKIGSHTPYTVSGDTLTVYYSDTHPVDTVSYFLANAGDFVLDAVPNSKVLMKQVNSGAAEVFSDNIVGIRYQVITPSIVDVVVTATADRRDEEFAEKNGMRTLTLYERVQVRNLAL